jgi:UDP:flavonoid glycosyltransferase YjiC (YdhE family)
MIVIPQGVDQHLVASQTARLGAAVIIGRDAVTVASLTAAVSRIECEHAALVSAAARLQQSFTQALPVEDAVDRVLALAVSEQTHG